jgi:hypothetical protein
MDTAEVIVWASVGISTLLSLACVAIAKGF